MSTLTAANLAGVQVLIIGSATGYNTDTTALSSSEQSALLNFVQHGGGVIISVNNDAFAGSSTSTVNNSYISPFGLHVTGAGTGIQLASVTSTSSPVTNGPFGLVSSIETDYPGWFDNLGSNADSLATLNFNGQPMLAVINPGTLETGSGGVVIYSDSILAINGSPDGAGGYMSADNQTLARNSIAFLSADGATPNGGTVTFSDQGGVLGSATLVNGVATFTTSSLAAGTYTVTASYGGTPDFAPSTTGTIVTAVGNGTAGYAGDNGPATAAELDNPIGIAFDSAGDLFVADYGDNVVREVVKATGDIITVAGDGTAGYSGDNGSATAAELNFPRDVAVDSAGDLFIADTNNNVIREVVKATGDIITVAGDGTAGYSGDGGPATAAELDGPRGVAVDSAGDLFIADRLNSVVREVVKATGDIITVAGNGTAGYSGDNGPATAAELDGPPASPSTPRATCSSPTRTTT